MMQQHLALPIRFLSFLLLCVSIFGWSCDQVDDSEPIDPSRTVIEVVRNQSELSSFYAALERLSLLPTLQNQNLNFTIFAPNNQAFTSFLQEAGYGSLEQVPMDELAELIRYHIAIGNRTATSLDSTLFTSLANKRIFAYTAADNRILLNGEVAIAENDLLAANGVVHVLPAVLTPPAQSLAGYLQEQATAAEAEFTLLWAAVAHAGLTETLNNANQRLTLLAPTDAAFRAAGYATAEDIQAADPQVIRNILRYHLLADYRFSSMLRTGNASTLQGQTVAINVPANTVKGNANEQPAQLLASGLDLNTTNGVVHAIDGLLLPN